MRNQLLLMLLVCSAAAHAQSGSFHSNFLPLNPVPCPFNAGVQVNKPVDWLIYQTQDGLWNGPADSSRCISASQNVNGISILLDQIDPGKPLFVRYESDNLNDFPLLPNHLFSAQAFVDFYPDTLPFSTGTNCPEGICSGMFIGIAIPDSTFWLGDDTRYQTALAKKSGFGCTIESCFPSEDFLEQYLRRVVLKFSFPPGADLVGKKLNLTYVLVEPNIWDNIGMIYVAKALPQRWNGVTYEMPVADASDIGFQFNYLMRYNASTYPSPEHQAYVEAVPVPNTPDPKTINLIVQPYETIEIQPYTNFRGALVEGSDSVRHTANLVNLGADLCLNFIDLIFTGGDEYRHGGGQLSINHPRSCMQFRDGSKIRVLEGATLHYGNDGAGMLMVCADGGIALERNATLVMDGMLSLSECNDNPEPQFVEMDLPLGAKLVFTENAVLTNQFSQYGQLKLKVHMMGGSIDDSALSPEERALIHREYPAASPVFENNIQVFPNPFQDKPSLNYLAAEQEAIRLKWFGLDGSLLLEAQLNAEKGINEWYLDGPKSAGVYLLVLEGSNGLTSKKVARH
jgi:hypothetical protein